MFAFGVAAAVTSSYPIKGTQVLLVFVMLDLIVAGPFGYLFPSLSLTLAAIGITAGLGTLYGRAWAKWLNVVLSGVVLYQAAMLFSGLVIYGSELASSWSLQDWAVPVLLLVVNGARIWYVLFTSEARVFFS